MQYGKKKTLYYPVLSFVIVFKIYRNVHKVLMCLFVKKCIQEEDDC